MEDIMNKDFNWKDGSNGANPFKVPEGYFEELEEKVMQQISSMPHVYHKKSRSIKMVSWISGIAATLLIGLIGFQQFHLKPQNEILKQEMLFSVIEYYAQDLDDVSFAAMMAEHEVLQDAPAQTDNDLLDYMNIDDLTLIEAVLGGN